MAEADREALASIILSAPDATKAALSVEISDGQLVAFSDTKTLFAADSRVISMVNSTLRSLPACMTHLPGNIVCPDEYQA